MKQSQVYLHLSTEGHCWVSGGVGTSWWNEAAALRLSFQLPPHHCLLAYLTPGAVLHPPVAPITLRVSSQWPVYPQMVLSQWSMIVPLTLFHLSKSYWFFFLSWGNFHQLFLLPRMMSQVSPWLHYFILYTQCITPRAVIFVIYLSEIDTHPILYHDIHFLHIFTHVYIHTLTTGKCICDY